MSVARSLKGRNRAQDRRIERHRIKAAGADHAAGVRHGYGRSVTVSAVNDNEGDIG